MCESYQQLRRSGCSLVCISTSDGVPSVPLVSVPAAYAAVADVLATLLLLTSLHLLPYLLCQALLLLASSLLLSSWLLVRVVLPYFVSVASGTL